ncbi:hypothetical protein H4684_003610 [Desulfomicrobium macestii]|uniref:Uncharacterized protein n=1 Tax=Desulfomicrobium macestii TaxID=90731 RepID=A0ABR9H892_9BACT|nr:hypothetical protein [Desulfomicrobium macestii]MBE1426926.1 hypothetical protein [Desulfomicrobium macestii]
MDQIFWVDTDRFHGCLCSKQLMKKSQKEEPRWYHVILSGKELTFAPTGGTRSKSDLTVPVTNKNETARFPMV